MSPNQHRGQECKDAGSCPFEHERRQNDMQIAALQKQIDDLSKKLDPVIEIWSALDGLVKVLRWIGLLVKWLAIFTAFVISIKVLGGGGK